MRIGQGIIFAGMSCLLLGSAAAKTVGEFNCKHTSNGEADDPAVVFTTLGSVPAIVRIPKKISQSPIVLWHGFGPPDSEPALMAALPLDEVPAVKVYLGLPKFGARTSLDPSDDLATRQKQDMANLVFEPVVMGAAKELPAVLKGLEQHRCIERGEPIGLFGFSAGGAAVLYALAEADVRIVAAVTLNASTGLSASVNAFERATKSSYEWNEQTRLLARRSDAVSRAKDIAAGNPPPALLLIHGADDAMLTPQIAVSLRDALQPLYAEANAANRLQLNVMPQMAHAWANAEHVDGMRTAIAGWFRTYLPAT